MVTMYVLLGYILQYPGTVFFNLFKNIFKSTSLVNLNLNNKIKQMHLSTWPSYICFNHLDDRRGIECLQQPDFLES